jgi:transposase InsO family protein
MRELRERGVLTAEARGAIADRLEVSERTTRNWLRDADERERQGAGVGAGQVGRRRFTLSQEDIDARAGFGTESDWHLFLLAKAMHANAAATQRSGVETVVMPEVHRTTVARAFRRQAPAALRAGLRGGEKEVAAFSPRFDIDHPLGDTWQGDVTQLPVLVRLRAGGRAFRPLWLAFREPKSHRIMAEALLPERPTSEMIAAVIGQGLTKTHLDDGTPLLAPRQVRLDNAGEHVSRELSRLLAGVGISVSLNTDSYASWQNGSIERFWGITKTDVLLKVPGSRLMGLTRVGDEYILPGGHAVAFDDLQAHLSQEFVPHYNTSEHSDARDGRVPDQVWTDEVGPLAAEPRRRPTPELVATLALAPSSANRAQATVHRRGVQVGSRFLTGPAVTGRIGDKVEVRRWPNRSLALAEVFELHSGRHLGAVTSHDQVSEEDRRRAHCDERHIRGQVAAAKHKAMHKYATHFATLQGPAVANTAPYAAGATPGWAPGESVAEADAFDRAHQWPAATSEPHTAGPLTTAETVTTTTSTGGEPEGRWVRTRVEDPGRGPMSLPTAPTGDPDIDGWLFDHDEGPA